jgi:hypothetical protein
MYSQFLVISALLSDALMALEQARSPYGKYLAVVDGAAALAGYDDQHAIGRLVIAAVDAGLDREMVGKAVAQGRARASEARKYRESTPVPKRLARKPPPDTPRPPPQVTVDALLLELRRGLSCLEEPGARDRLRRCDEAAIEQIAVELLTWKDKGKSWLPDWSKDNVETLIKVWRALGDRA